MFSAAKHTKATEIADGLGNSECTNVKTANNQQPMDLRIIPQSPHSFFVNFVFFAAYLITQQRNLGSNGW